MHIYIRAYDNQTFSGQINRMSGQINRMSGQIKFGQTNILYIINRNFMKFPKENECPDNFKSLS